MPHYRLNDDAVRRARQLIDAGEVDADTPWSDAAPSADHGNRVTDGDGYDAYASWHLGIDVDATAETKGRHHFPYGDFQRVNRAALIHAEQRASQNDHHELAGAAKDLLEHLDSTCER